MGGVVYDGAGNILNDGVNQYLYDGEGRICAVSAEGVSGAPQLTGYIYNAQGQRIAKGNITAWSCDPTVNGFKPMSDYVLGLSGEQVTEMGMDASGVMAWQHTNVYALEQPIATYDNDGLHFYLNHPVGTRRAQTDYAGRWNRPAPAYRLGMRSVAPTPSSSPRSITSPAKNGTPNPATTTSGLGTTRLDGPVHQPDWSAKEDPLPHAKFGDPQTLNLYAYVRNNPLSKADPDGHCPWCLPVLAGVGVVGESAEGGGAIGAFAGPPGVVVGVVAGAFIGGGILAYEHFQQDAPAPAATPAPAAAPDQKAPDFVVTPGGTAVSTDPNRVAGSLAGAPGVTSTPAQSPSGEQGTLHTGVQTANGPVDVRTMSGSSRNKPRIVITHPGTNNPKTPDGKATNDKGQSHIPSDSKIRKPNPQQ